MYKDKEKQKQANRESAKRYRQKGMTPLASYPDIIDKLTDSAWRERLEKICQSFKSRNPHDVEVCWLGDTSLVTVCDWLECTG